MFIMGYIPAHNRVYLADKDVNVYGYSLSLSVVEYQTAVLRGDMEAAGEILPTLPKDQLNKVARFLEGRGMVIFTNYYHYVTEKAESRHDTDLKELALQVTTDPDHKFDLSLQLDDLDTAVDIARSVPDGEAETKWKALGDRALAGWRFDLARESFEKANDLGALMLLLLATGDKEGLRKLAASAGTPVSFFFVWCIDVLSAGEKGANNLAFATLFQLGDADACIDLLIDTQRAPEAALFARTYAPRSVPVFSLIMVLTGLMVCFGSRVPKAVDAWRGELESKNRPKIACGIAHPVEHPELFEEGVVPVVNGRKE